MAITDCIYMMYTGMNTIEQVEALHVLLVWGLAQHLALEDLLYLQRLLANLELKHGSFDLGRTLTDCGDLAKVVEEIQDMVLGMAGPRPELQI